MTAFVQGRHEYLVPVLPDRGPDGRGRARTWQWPGTVREVTPEQLAGEPLDAVLLQRPEELELAERWTGRVPGRDLPAVYVEHNTPRGDVAGCRHPLADRADLPLVHVTAFNAAAWDNGRAPVRVVEHGVVDPGPLWTGHRPTLALVVNEPVRRRRVAGIDLAARVAAQVPVELYGMGLAGVEPLLGAGLAGLHEDLPQAELHRRMAAHRAYLHPYRWTSLGLALVEAMTIGMPVLVLAATAAPESVPPGAGTVSSDPEVLAAAARRLVADPALAVEQGRCGREHALRRFGLQRFLDDWDRTLKEVAG
jgi:glycosyltransferase involved in cell wall biosynthesis